MIAGCGNSKKIYKMSNMTFDLNKIRALELIGCFHKLVLLWNNTNKKKTGK